MTDHRIVEWIRGKYNGLAGELSELRRRRWAAVEAVSLGRGGIAAVCAATGMARTTVRRGIRELDGPASVAAKRQRQPGGGRKRAEVCQPALPRALERLVEPTSRGDPRSPLRWTCKSTRRLAEELTAQGYPVTNVTVARLLKDSG